MTSWLTKAPYDDCSYRALPSLEKQPAESECLFVLMTKLNNVRPVLQIRDEATIPEKF